MPSWIGPWEIAIVVVLALLIFGPKKLPDLGSSLGKSITGFRKGLKESTEEFKAAVKDDAAPEPATPVTPAASTPVTPAAADTATAAEATDTAKTE